MTNHWPVISARFPYLSITLLVHDQILELDALLDTGFDGDVAVPSGMLSADTPVNEVAVWHLADGRRVETPMHHASIRLGTTEIKDRLVTVLGSEPIIGCGLIRHFAVTLDHGRRVIVEP